MTVTLGSIITARGVPWALFKRLRKELVSFSLVPLGLLAGLIFYPQPGLTSQSIPLTPDPIRPSSRCPEDIQRLMKGMLRDLPGYANRVASRSLGITEETGFGTLLLVSPAEFEPIDLDERPSSQLPNAAQELHQVFFTSLERRYQAGEALNLQGFHWLFLTPGPEGWWLSLMYSSFGNYPEEVNPTPPQETSQGIIGQAVQLWLRDCRAGAVSPIDPTDSGE